jgi:hypothetical protein
VATPRMCRMLSVPSRAYISPSYIYIYIKKGKRKYLLLHIVHNHFELMLMSDDMENECYLA